MQAPDLGRQRGFSLLEVVAAIVILGLMFAGFVTVYATVLRQSSEPQLGVQALAIADGLLDEITSRRYRDPDTGVLCGGPEGQRPLFDDVCDYHALPQNGCVATSSACPVAGDCACGRDGQPIDGLRGFQVAVAVAPATLTGVNGLQVQVQVSHAGLAGEGVILRAFRSED